MGDEKQYLVVTSRLPPMSYEEAKAHAARIALHEGNGLAHVVKVVGLYSTAATPVGYCVESAYEPGSVQVWPEAALIEWDGEK